MKKICNYEYEFAFHKRMLNKKDIVIVGNMMKHLKI